MSEKLKDTTGELLQIAVDEIDSANQSMLSQRKKNHIKTAITALDAALMSLKYATP